MISSARWCGSGLDLRILKKTVYDETAQTNPFRVILENDQDLIEMILRGNRVAARGVCRQFRDLQPRPMVTVGTTSDGRAYRRRNPDDDELEPQSAAEMLAMQQSMRVVGLHCTYSGDRFGTVMQVLPQYEALTRFELDYTPERRANPPERRPYRPEAEAEQHGENMARLAAVLPLCERLADLEVSGAQNHNRESAGPLATALPRCTSLTRLALYGTDVAIDFGERALPAALGQCRSLRHLLLDHMNISDMDMRRLAAVLPQCTSLSSLSLQFNFFRDDGTRHLAAVLPQCTSLAELSLADNSIGSRGVRHLAEVLPQCTSLTRLDLQGNVMGTEGAGHLARVLPQCTSLTALDLRSNGVDAAGRARIGDVLERCGSSLQPFQRFY